MSFFFFYIKEINVRRVSIPINVKMDRAPTTVLVDAIRSQHGSGVRKRKYKRRRSGKNKRKGGRKDKTNVRRKGRGIGKLLQSIIKGW